MKLPLLFRAAMWLAVRGFDEAALRCVHLHFQWRVGRSSALLRLIAWGLCAVGTLTTLADTIEPLRRAIPLGEFILVVLLLVTCAVQALEGIARAGSTLFASRRHSEEALARLRRKAEEALEHAD